MKTKIFLATSVCILTLGLVLFTNQSQSGRETARKVSIKPMDESVFWDIISNFNWNAEDENSIMKPAMDLLTEFTTAEICKFDDILSEKLFLLENPAFASNFERGPAQYLSPDMFLYRRCFVVANGREHYNKVISSPWLGATDETFEGLLFLASQAYKKKTGSKEYPHQTKFNYETYSNRKAWHE